MNLLEPLKELVEFYPYEMHAYFLDSLDENMAIQFKINCENEVEDVLVLFTDLEKYTALHEPRSLQENDIFAKYMGQKLVMELLKFFHGLELNVLSYTLHPQITMDDSERFIPGKVSLKPKISLTLLFSAGLHAYLLNNQGKVDLPEYFLNNFKLGFKINGLDCTIQGLEYFITLDIADIMCIEYIFNGQSSKLYLTQTVISQIANQYGIPNSSVEYYLPLLNIIAYSLQKYQLDIQVINIKSVREMPAKFAILQIEINENAAQEITRTPTLAASCVLLNFCAYVPMSAVSFWQTIQNNSALNNNAKYANDFSSLQLEFPVILGSANIEYKDIKNLEVGAVVLLDELIEGSQLELDSYQINFGRVQSVITQNGNNQFKITGSPAFL